MKKILKKIIMTLCALSVCLGVSFGQNAVTADAATTRNRTITISSPRSLGNYDAYLYVNGVSTPIGTSKAGLVGSIKLSKKMPITVNKNAKVYVRIEYKNAGGKVIASNILSIISEQQLKTGFYSINVNVTCPDYYKPQAKATFGL